MMVLGRAIYGIKTLRDLGQKTDFFSYILFIFYENGVATRKSSKSAPVPFEFVIERLVSRHPLIKPMFGCHAVYIGEKIVLILRKKGESGYDNGVWVATTAEHHESLKRDFPSLRPIRIFGDAGSWQNIPENADDFEESVIALCERILTNDVRIGKVPAKKKVKKPIRSRK
jgi:hypothetical protein